MNKAQKTVLKAKIDAEKALVDDLIEQYEKAQKQVQSKLYELANRKDMENIQTIIHQQKYQQMILKNINAGLKGLKEGQFKSVDEYLKGCYNLGYIGNMYDLMYQGIPLTVPTNPKKIKYAIETNSKLSKNLWDSLSNGVDTMKKKVQQEITLGILKGSSWGDIAKRMEAGITTTKMINGFHYTMRIARTEGHRIQEIAAYDSMCAAKEKGADVVKQWCSALDDRTRPSHALLDGQIREIDKPFEVNGHKGMFPGGFGIASEDIYCRCTTLQRAKWALDQDELDTLKKRAEYFHLDKSDSFKEFKKKYLKLPANADTMKVEINGWQGLGFKENYQTKKEAIQSLKNNHHISFSDSRKYPIDDELMIDFVSWMDSFEKEYPEFVQSNQFKVPKICIKAPSGMGNAVGYFKYSYYGQPVEIALNAKYHVSKKVFEEYEKSCIKSNWTVANATSRKTFVHEYGHYVSNSLQQMHKSDDRHWEYNFIQECVDEYKTTHPDYKFNSYIGLSKDGQVSRYGMTNESECFAETFAEYFGNENPREFAQIFGKKLNDILKGMK